MLIAMELMSCAGGRVFVGSVCVSNFTSRVDSSFSRRLGAIHRLKVRCVDLHDTSGGKVTSFAIRRIGASLLPHLRTTNINISDLNDPVNGIGVSSRRNFRGRYTRLRALYRVTGILGYGCVHVFDFFVPRNGSPTSCHSTIVRGLHGFVTVTRGRSIVLVRRGRGSVCNSILSHYISLVRALGDTRFGSTFSFTGFMRYNRSATGY